jgi:O-antigen/teichoic acid export membrane protein
MIAGRWGMRAIGLASTVILARLLAPDDFGVIAIALIIVGLLETIAYAGVDLALMRPGADTREHYDTAWTIQLIQGALIAGVLLLIAPWVAPFFSEARATAVIQVIALRPLIIGCQNIGTVAFRKELDFAKDFRFGLYTKLLNFTIVVGMAFWLRNYWALVAGMTTSSLIEVILSYVMHPYRPRLCLRRWREIWGFSQWLIISRAGAFLNRKVDEMVVGRLLGTSAMGGYHVANELATMPNSELVMPLRRAMFPTLAKVSENPAELERLFRLSFSAITAMCFSVGFGLMSVAPELVPIVLGDKWTSAVAAMRWLAVHAAFSSLILTLEMPLWVTGRTRLTATQTWLDLSLLIPTAYFAVTAYGVEGAAIARLTVSLVVLPVMVHFVASACRISALKLYGDLWRPLLAGLTMSAVLSLLTPDVIGSMPLTLALKILVGVALYPATLLLLWLLAGRPWGVEREAAKALSAFLAQRRSRREQ